MNEERPASAPPVPGYAGHADAPARVLSDQQVRAWVGETLADLPEPLPDGGLQDRLDALLVRCEFGDPHVSRALEDDRFGQPDLAALVEARDRALVEAASRVRTTGPEGLGAVLEALERTFDERARAIEEQLKPPP